MPGYALPITVINVRVDNARRDSATAAGAMSTSTLGFGILLPRFRPTYDAADHKDDYIRCFWRCHHLRVKDHRVGEGPAEEGSARSRSIVLTIKARIRGSRVIERWPAPFTRTFATILVFKGSSSFSLFVVRNIR